MTQEEKRIAIAEACGWVFKEGGIYYHSSGVLKHLPDYLNDLNAMHEAEKQIKDFSHYARHLKWIMLGPDQIPQRERWKVVHATAAQRAEAFGRTLGLWKE